MSDVSVLGEGGGGGWVKVDNPARGVCVPITRSPRCRRRGRQLNSPLVLCLCWRASKLGVRGMVSFEDEKSELCLLSVVDSLKTITDIRPESKNHTLFQTKRAKSMSSF